MQEIVRNFLARRLGRGAVRASSNADGSVTVELECELSVAKQQEIRLVATPGCVDALGLNGVELLYRLSRHAISQVQDRVRKRTLDFMGSELNCERTPWNGDLTETPYGGATVGYTAPIEARVSKKIKRIAAAHFRHLSRRDG